MMKLRIVNKKSKSVLEYLMGDEWIFVKELGKAVRVKKERIITSVNTIGQFARKIMEKHLGRKLIQGEIVHHMDHNPFNNYIENLYLFNSPREHSLYHYNLRKMVQKELKDNGVNFRLGGKKYGVS